MNKKKQISSQDNPYKFSFFRKENYLDSYYYNPTDMWIDYIERDKPVDIRNQLILRNKLLVTKAITDTNSARFGTSLFEDLFQEGLVGLTKAVESFDPTRKIKFASYSYKFIVGAINQYFRDKHYIIRFSQIKYERQKRIVKKIMQYHQSLGNEKESFQNLILNKSLLQQCYTAIYPTLSTKDQMPFEKFFSQLKEYFQCRNVFLHNDMARGQSTEYFDFTGETLPVILQKDKRVDKVVNKLLSYK